MRRFFSWHFYLVVAVIAIAAAAGWVELRRLTRPLTSVSYIPLKPVIREPHLLLREYVQIDTSNPPGKEAAGARFLVRYLASKGISAETIESAPGRANVYARLKGKRSGEGLLLMHHIDVVPADPSAWSEPPFSGNVKMNMMYGRGTLDMKSIGICELLAFVAAAQSGRQPERDLVFLAVSDEEEGGALGTQWLLKNRPDLFSGVKYAINEGGITETLGDKITFFSIEVGSKEFVKLKITSRSLEEIRRARIALEPDIEPAEPDRILPEIRDYFRAVAPHRIENRELLGDIDAAVKNGAFWRLNQSFRSLTQNNLQTLGLHQDGDSYSMVVELANLPDEDPDQRIAAVRKTVSPYQVSVEVLAKDDPAPIVSWRTAFFEKLSAIARGQYGGVDTGPVVLPYSTNDSRFLRRHGIIAYGVWPFPVNLYQTMGIHGANERIRLDWFLDGVEYTRKLVFEWCFAN